MPTIPQYQSGSIRNTDLPAVRFNANASGASFGGAQAEAMGELGKALQGAGSTATQIGVAEMVDENKAMVRDALSEDQNAARNFLTSNVFNQEGQNAVNISKKAQDELGRIGKDRAAKLSSPAQQEMYRTMWRDVQDSHMAHVGTFQQQAMKTYERVSKEAHNQVLIQDAGLYWNDPKFVEKNYQDGASNVRSSAAPFGKDHVTVKTQEFANHYYASVVEAAQAQSPAAAKDVLNTYRAKLDPKYVASKEAQINRLMQDTVIQGAATTANEKNLDLVEARAFISKTVEPQFVEQTMGVFKNMQEERKQVGKSSALKAESDAYMSQKSNPSMLPPTWMDARQANEFIANGEKLIKGVSEHEKDVTYGQLMSQFSADPEGFSKSVNLNKFESSLRSGDANHLRGLMKDQTESKEDKGFTKAVNDAKADANKLPEFKINRLLDSKPTILAKQQAFDKYIAVFTNELRNSDKTPASIEKIKTQLLSDVVLKKGSWFGLFTGEPFSDVKGSAFQNRVTPGAISQGGAAVPVQGIPRATSSSVLSPLTGLGTSEPVQQPGVVTPQTPVAPIPQGVEGVRQDALTQNTATAPRTDVTISDAQTALNSRLGIHGGVTLNDFGQTVSNAASKVSKTTKSAASKVVDTYNKIVGYPGESFAKAFPGREQVSAATQLHDLMEKSGVDVSNLDGIYQRMNGIQTPDPSAPGGMTLGGANTEGMYIDAVNAMADRHASELAQQLKKYNNITKKELNKMHIGQQFPYQGGTAERSK